MQGTRVDPARPPDARVGGDVRVALEQVVELLAGEELLAKAIVVAVQHCDALAVEREVGHRTEAGDADLVRITRETGTVPIRVAPNERGLCTREFIDDLL